MALVVPPEIDASIVNLHSSISATRVSIWNRQSVTLSLSDSDTRSDSAHNQAFAHVSRAETALPTPVGLPGRKLIIRSLWTPFRMFMSIQLVLIPIGLLV